ncbi:nuclear transport factor 2 family protein [Nocardia sp. XZ_19_231]|uniref:nuclear transport factor 2 family protein n=1 Tax=Nocardia sp. XZ_19_231 TaxID=2769252 RepID=UPI00188F4FC3|nr:nuclear transport factor 2 family protein [Nocardia sp. XZ_19_231]
MDDIEAIKQVKYRYLYAIDTKAWEVLADTLTENVIGDYGEDGHHGGNLTFVGRDNLVEFMREALGPTVLTEHRVNHPEIIISGDEATGRWYLQDRVIMREENLMLIGAAFYNDRYRRTADGWKIDSTRYGRTYEATISLQDLPSFTVRTGVALNL